MQRPHDGAFHLTATSHPDGFPAPEACGAAMAIAEPSSTSMRVVSNTRDYSELDDMTGTCGGATPERVLTFTATRDATIVARTEPYAYDTLVYVRRGDCANGEELACNDDAEPRLENESEVTFPVVAGETIFVVLDGWISLTRDRTVAVDLRAQ